MKHSLARFASLALLVGASACSQRATPPDVSAASDVELRRQVGQRVVLRGVFSLYGKQGPFVRFGNQLAYIMENQPGEFSWGEPWTSMQDREVTVEGTLRFRPERTLTSAPDPPVARLPDYYYFDLESTQIELVR